MKLVISPKAKRQLSRLSKIDQIIVINKIRRLVDSEGRLGSLKLKKFKNAYRIRIGNYRIVYKKKRNMVRVVLIGHRKDIYKLVERLF